VKVDLCMCVSEMFDDADKSGGDNVHLSVTMDDHDYDIRSETAVSFDDGDDKDKDIKPVIKTEVDDTIFTDFPDIKPVIKSEVDDTMSTDFPGTQHFIIFRFTVKYYIHRVSKKTVPTYFLLLVCQI